VAQRFCNCAFRSLSKSLLGTSQDGDSLGVQEPLVTINKCQSRQTGDDSVKA
jgi:hypothetical protein